MENKEHIRRGADHIHILVGIKLISRGGVFGNKMEVKVAIFYDFNNMAHSILQCRRDLLFIKLSETPTIKDQQGIKFKLPPMYLGFPFCFIKLAFVIKLR